VCPYPPSAVNLSPHLILFASVSFCFASILFGFASILFCFASILFCFASILFVLLLFCFVLLPFSFLSLCFANFVSIVSLPSAVSLQSEPRPLFRLKAKQILLQFRFVLLRSETTGAP